MLTGRRVGLLVINSCGSQLLVRQRLMELHAGTLALPGGRNSSSILANIMGYVGAYFSSSSIAASETLNAFTRPFVQVGKEDCFVHVEGSRVLFSLFIPPPPPLFFLSLRKLTMKIS